MDRFPTNIAIGKAFCNRTKERSLLKDYIKHGRHTVLIAPRRYGKTSLINQVLFESKLPHCMIELTLGTSAEDIHQIIVKHTSQLLYQILPKSIQAKQNILKLFKWLNPELVLTVGGQKLVFHPESAKLNTAEDIAKILKKLDEAATSLKKRVVVVMDEFQQLGEIENHTIEASIRHAMQYSQFVSYVFLGSSRHMLLSMFNSKNRPFYNSCEIMYIDRISEEDYVTFIQQAAMEEWKKPLTDKALSKIFELTEFHPSYINRICGYFWLTHQFPTANDIEAYWKDFVNSKRSEFMENILNLSQNQKKVLAYLAQNPTRYPSSQAVCNQLKLSEASIRQAVRKLQLIDYIHKDKQEMIKVLDPAFKSFINNLSNI